MTRRWLGYLAFAVVFAIACGFLSAWQASRGNDAVAANALLDKNFNSQPLPLQSVLPGLTSFRADQEWLRVTVSGSYLPKEQLLVRNRPTDAGPGFEVLTPLRLADGSVFIVDRGWVPTGNKQDRPDYVAPAPSGAVVATVRLRPSEPKADAGSTSGGEIGTIALGEVQARTGGAVYTGAYGILDSQTPVGAAGLTPVVTSEPTQDEGLHWSYMIQWVLFALIGFFGLFYAVRQEIRLRREDEPEERARAAERERKRALKPTDADIEDELIDSVRR
ncbi:MAG: SURF1-like protein [Microbacteriaceae bacterium]|jgi:cytochrome oxidase assembly protein ShyY1|nr:SURF1-like protein [Microbacteriaceae bacterium]